MALRQRAVAAGVTIQSRATVWGAFAADEVGAIVADRATTYRPRRLVLAPGAHERPVPVPGWTLPGVMTTGAAQTLLRAYQVAPGERVLIAGNGPLNMQVAAELVRAGATVVGLAELAARPLPGRMDPAARMLVLAPDLIRDGLRYQLTLRRAGVPTLHRTALVRAEGGRTVERAALARIDGEGRVIAGSERSFDVDSICVGYGFLSSTELSRAAGCRHRFDAKQHQLVAEHDGNGRTSVEHVWAVGDGAGVGGARIARALGTIAAADVLRSLGVAARASLRADERRARRAYRTARRFQDALWTLYEAPYLSDQLATEETLLCRCESVSRAAVDAAVHDDIEHVGAIKRATRAGMGGCQGRYCGTVLADVSSRSSGGSIGEYSLFSPASPIKPTRIGSIAGEPGTP
jgi:NADPH-dependent 2,4-dienoyl-CoA reductase/sulfur reductase-like enzyme